ncbi:MAG: hypothetical protein J5894_03230 [Clostridia bacterium]|nr:hypothetical protein [Clostridia bacterium]
MIIRKSNGNDNDGQAKKGLGRGLTSLLDDNSPAVTVERPKVIVRKDDRRDDTNSKEGTDNGKKRTRS